MKPGTQVRFGPFTLDPSNEIVSRGRHRVPLTPKAFAVLRYLVANAGRRLGKDEFLEALWPGVAVGDAVLKVCIREIRKALCDDARRPRFIRTDHRRGYSFVARVDRRESGAQRGDRAQGRNAQSPPRLTLVGRIAELARMHVVLARALEGERQVLFITGEPGIGKTALVDTFLSTLTGAGGPWVARGQCLQHYGAGEPYLPVLEALHGLARSSAGERLVTLLARHAPTWLVQMPSLAEAFGEGGLARETLGATRERMLREMADALDALTMAAPLVLVLEDIHWTDVATLDLIGFIAQRRAPARLLLVATYRPVEVAVSGHPVRVLKQELATRGACGEVPLACLTEAAVAQFLAARLGGRAIAPALSTLVHRRTEGHPLFMVNVLDFLRDQGLIIERAQRWELNEQADALAGTVPESIRQTIDRQIDCLGVDDVRVLEAGAVAGVEFSAAAVAAAVAGDVVQVEERCDAMARRELFLRPRGTEEWPDGTEAARYEFVHSLYQNVLYQRTASSRRVLLHRRIGEREEAAWGPEAGVIAAELAAHFEAGRDVQRALRYLRAAAENAARRYANREAIDYLTRARALAARLGVADRLAVDMSLQERLGMLRRSMGDLGGAAEDFRVLARRAREAGQSDTESRALFYLASTLSSIDRTGCLEAAGQAVELSLRVDDDLLRARTRGSSGYWHSFLRGWRREDAHASVEALATVRTAKDPALLSLLLGRYAYFQLLESAYTETCATAEEGMRLALEVGDAYEYLFSAFYRALGLLYRGRWGEMLTLVHEGIRMAERNGGAMWLVLFRLELAWLREEAGDAEGARPLCEEALERAKTAHYEEKWEVADAEVSRALAAARGDDTPLAAWRAHATAARVCAHFGREGEASAHRARGEVILRGLAESLTGAGDLRLRMLASSRHRELLHRA